MLSKLQAELKWAKKEAEQLAARAQEAAAAAADQSEKGDLEQAQTQAASGNARNPPTSAHETLPESSDGLMSFRCRHKWRRPGTTCR